MARWAAVNLNRGELDGHRILSEASYDVLWEKSRQHDVGLSWFLSDQDGQTIVAHKGRDDGFETAVKLVPSRKIGVIVMANSDHSPAFKVSDKALEVALEK